MGLATPGTTYLISDQWAGLLGIVGERFFKVPNGIQTCVFYFVRYIIQMKTVILSLLVLQLALGNLVGLGSQCPEQSVPDSNNVCIVVDYIEGCLQYKSSQECLKCSKEYELNLGKCDILDSYAQNPPANTGCLQLSGDGSCANCANGYLKAQGSCKPGVKFCEEYNSDLTCKRCQIEYSLIFNECKHNLLLGCKVEQSDHTCSECYKPFVLQNYQCVVKECKSYNDYGCVSCECGYYLSETRACLKMQEGCLKYYRGVCSECLPHYKLKGGSCVIDGCIEYKNQFCQTCKEEYALENGLCNFKDCLEWDEDRCTLCKAGFNLVQGKCQKSSGNFVCSG